MESTTERLELRREVEIAASPDTVWDLIVDPAKSTSWWGSAVRLDPTPGGVLRVVVTPGSVAVGEVLEIDPPRRLVCSWGWESGGGGPEAVPPGSTTVEIELVPSGDGTLLKLVHRGFRTPEAVANHGAGWEHYLGRLSVRATGVDPGPDPWASRHA